MRPFLARALSLIVALGVLALLVVHAGTTGCATEGAARQEPQSLGNAMQPPPPAPPVTTAAAPTTPPVELPPAEYLPATKAAPVFYPRKVAVPAQAPPQAQQQQGKP